MAIFFRPFYLRSCFPVLDELSTSRCRSLRRILMKVSLCWCDLLCQRRLLLDLLDVELLR